MTSGSGSAAGSLYVLDAAQANPAFSGEQLHVRAWLKVQGMELRVASFNAPSGAFLTGQLAATTIASGAAYEAHDLLSPSDKDRCLDDAIKRLRSRREVVVVGTEGMAYVPLDAAASPNTVVEVLDVYAFVGDTDGRTRGTVLPWRLVQTGTGPELRVPGLGASQALVLDALLVPSLGALDTATVNLPGSSDRFVLAMATAKAYDLITRNTVGQEMAKFRQLRAEAAHEASRLASRFRPQIDRPVRFDSDYPSSTPAWSEW